MCKIMKIFSNNLHFLKNFLEQGFFFTFFTPKVLDNTYFQTIHAQKIDTTTYPTAWSSPPVTLGKKGKNLYCLASYSPKGKRP